MPAEALPETTKIPLWLDCDPGHDDAFAILLAAHHPALHLLGLSTVHGNASVARTTHNALSILTALGRTDVPVYPGASKPSSRAEAIYAPDIHGPTGLDGTSLLPTPTVPAVTKTDAVLAMRTALLAQPPDTAWLVATGALTNVAALFARFPDVAAHIAGLSIMGGAVGGDFTDAPMGTLGGEGSAERIGNVTPWAEFNVYCDPDAARSIFRSAQLASKTTLVTLDLTHQVLATEAVLRRLLDPSSRPPASTLASASAPTTASTPMSLPTLTTTATPTSTPTPTPPSTSTATATATATAPPPPPPSPLRRMLHDLLTFFARMYADVFGLRAGPPLHDPLAVAVLLDAFAHAHALTEKQTRDGTAAPAPATPTAASHSSDRVSFSDQERLKFDDREGERFRIDVVVVDTEDDGGGGAGDGEGGGDGGNGERQAQVGRTKITPLERGESGVRVPRAVDVVAFWDVLEGCVGRAERAGGRVGGVGSGQVAGR